MNNKLILQVQKLIYLGTICHYELNIIEHINYIDDNFHKFTLQLAKSAKLNWIISHKTLQSI